MSGNLVDPELRAQIERGEASILQKPIAHDKLERALSAVLKGKIFR